MADFAGLAFGMADIAFRVISYLNDVRKSMTTIADDIDALIREVQNLRATHEQLQQALDDGRITPASLRGASTLRAQTERVLQDATQVVGTLERCVVDICGREPAPSSKTARLRQSRKKLASDDRLASIRSQLQSHNSSLNMWLNILQLVANHDNQQKVLAALADMQDHLADLKDKTQPSQPSADDNEFEGTSAGALHAVAKSAEAVERSMTDANANKYFDIPDAVAVPYVGREREAEELAAWLLPDSSDKARVRMQRRFVVHGVSGSGKTQFCCKFAEDHRERFWGVFCIDGRTPERLRLSLQDTVAAAAGINYPNYKACNNWLSNLDKRWLLIVDNADDPEIRLEQYLPKGDRGHILITTQNPELSIFGNIGPGSFQFSGMDHTEARNLLLTAAGLSKPWDGPIATLATEILEALGYLALAVTHAAAAIRTNVLRLDDYLQVHEARRREYSKAYTERAHRRLSRRRTNNSTENQDYDEIEDRRPDSAEAAMDIVLGGISESDHQEDRDAMQLFNMIAFLHGDSIRSDFFGRCVTNAALEKRQALEDASRETVEAGLIQRLQHSLQGFAIRFFQRQTVETLPDMLREGRLHDIFDRVRLRKAFRRLLQHSLISYNTETDAYSMHSFVQKWARDRLGTGGQCVWSEAAAFFVSTCVLLPPLGNTVVDDKINTSLLKHVQSAQTLQEKMQKRLLHNWMQGRRKYTPLQSRYPKLSNAASSKWSPTQIRMQAKFALIFAHGGKWDEAKQILKKVQHVVVKSLGMGNASTRRITAALAGVCLRLGQSDECAALQQDVLSACQSAKGAQHRETLTAMQKLGEARFHQGRISEARDLQRQALDGMTRELGSRDEATLEAAQSLGLTLSLLRTEEALREAKKLQEDSLAGMEKLHGPDHLKVLSAREMLCATIALMTDEMELHRAVTLMQDTREKYETALGAKHPETLKAMLTLARVKAALRDFEGAQLLFDQGFAIAEKCFEPDFPPLLWAQYMMGQMWVRQGRWRDARDLLVRVTALQKISLQGFGASHPERVGPLVELARAHQELGEYEACDCVVAEVFAALERISVIGNHPVETRLRALQEEWWQRRRTTAVADADASLAAAGPSTAGEDAGAAESRVNDVQAEP